MSQIFISYANEDVEHAKALAETLRDLGWSVWWDRKIPIGKTFDEVIERQLKDAGCVVVLWTRASVTSAWVKVEADEAHKRGALIPVLIEPVEPPLAFRYLQFADLTKWDGRARVPEIEEVSAAVALVVGPPSPPVTTPPLERTTTIRLERDPIKVHWRAVRRSARTLSTNRPVKRGPREVVALVLLVTGLPPLIGWLLGLGLLLSSPAWSRRQKILGALVWPGGLAGTGALVYFLTTGSAYHPLITSALLVGALVPPVAVGAYLFHSAARRR